MTDTNSLFERRREMVALIGKGADLAAVVSDLSAKYRVSARLIYHDWRNRGRWLRAVVRLGDPSKIDLLCYGLDMVIRNTWYEYARGDNSSARVGALRLLKETYTDYLNLLRDLKPELDQERTLKIEVTAPWRNKWTEETGELLEKYKQLFDSSQERVSIDATEDEHAILFKAASIIDQKTKTNQIH